MASLIGRNTQLDFSDGLILVRDTSSNDTPMSLNPGTALQAADANVSALLNVKQFNNAIYTNGARLIGFRFWGTVQAGTAVITVKNFMKAGPIARASTGTLTLSKGGTILAATATFNGSSTANTHPVTGDTVAATTFYELSAISASYEQDPRIRYYPTTGSGVARELFITMDCLGMDVLIPEITSISNSARIVCGAWRIT